MARYSKDRGTRSISIGPALASSAPNENANTTPKNSGSATGAGDEFGLIATSTGHRLLQNLSWDYRISGGTLSALTIVLQASNDGVNWDTIDTGTNTSGESRVVVNFPYLFVRLNITTFTSSSGSPVVTGGITA